MTSTGPQNRSPTGWIVRPLQDVADIASGITKGRRPDGRQTVSLPYLRVANVQAGYLNLQDIAHIDVPLGEVHRYRLAPGDVVMTEGGDPDKLGRGALWSGQIDSCVHQNHIFRVRPMAERLLPQYLQAYLGSPRAREYFLRCAKQTTGIASINMTQLRRFPVALPPLPEQRRIADILDKADAIRRKRQEAIRLTEDLLRSAFLDMFGDPVTNPKGWPVVKLGTCFKVRPQIGTIVPATDNGVQLVVRVGELGGLNVALNQCKRVTLEATEKNRFLAHVGDVLLARAIGSAEHLGKASLLQPCAEPVVFDSHVMRLRFTDNTLLPEFFVWWLRSDGGRAQFMRRAGRTAVQFNVNAAQISEIDVALPLVARQRQFVDLANDVGTVRQHMEDDGTELRRFFESLVQQAFRGRL